LHIPLAVSFFSVAKDARSVAGRGVFGRGLLRKIGPMLGLSYLKGIKKSNHHCYSHQNRHPNRHLDRRLGRYLDRRIARPVRNRTLRDLEYLESPGGLQLGTLIVEGIL